jgi:hypothetical protein
LLTLNSVTNDVEVLRINAPGGSGGIQAKADIGFSYFDTAAEASAAIGFEEFGAASTGGILLFKTRPDGSTSSTRPTERMRLDQVGNLGLGVAPSAWNSAYPTMQIGLGASITGVSTTADAVFVAANTRSAGGAYNSGTYLATAAASYYRQLTGAHSWHTAPSGTAGTAITFTQAMTLDASGRLQLGTTTSGGDLTVYENTSAANKVARFVQANSSAGTLGAVEIVSAVTGGSALDVAQWNNASGSWIQRWYENASRDVGDSISTTATFVAGINTDGNFGIGTSSPAAKLDVVNASGRAARIGGFQLSGTTSSADGGNNLLSSGAFWNGTNFTATQTTSATVQLGNGAINFYTESGLTPSGTYSGTVRATIDSSGNLGLGVTPSAWGSLFKAIQVGDYASFSHNLQNAAAIVASNAYNNDNTNWRYLFSSVAASRYEAGQGQHRWFTAPSGTAGNAITFTQAMTLDASGNLGVGTTSPTSFGAGFVNTQINGTTGSFLNLSVNGTRTGYMYSDASGTEVGNLTNGFYRIFVNGSERARIDTSGNLLVGLTSATGVAKLQVSGAIRTTGFTVATLPAGTVGMRTYVTDALAPSFGVTVSGGGAVTIPVFHNGTNWIVA